ncbi:hypothetical protein [Dehalogenimonas sp. 4OHTPN]|uniref:Uncharacterized protein n=1 Tax=Dehalogenimonas sp. 4OHTPN TaxID=3166643 RepID=A0AAU8GAN2_9CHLR
MNASPASDIGHVAVEPPPDLSPELIARAAAVLDRAPCDIRLLLAGRVPKLIAHFDNFARADAAAGNLRAAGLTALALSDASLRLEQPVFMAREIDFTAGELVFTGDAGQRRVMEKGQVFLIVEGIGRRAERVETAVQKTRFSPGATLLAGGIPIWRTRTETSSSESVTAEPFIRLYEASLRAPPVAVSRDTLKSFAFLGGGISGSSTVNLRKTADLLRSVCPQAGYDNRLSKPAAAVSYTGRLQEDLELNCRLIFLFRAAQS